MKHKADCTVKDCHEVQLQKGYCPKHYMKWYRHGDAEFKVIPIGDKRTRTSWVSMRQRCNNPKDPSYGRYGGRGITVCDRWSNFSMFLADMGKRPEGTSLDRIDINGDYEPSNCRWATIKEQANNTSANVTIEYSGVSLSVALWAEILGLNRGTLAYRKYAGWSAYESLTKPSQKGLRVPRSILVQRLDEYITETKQ